MSVAVAASRPAHVPDDRVIDFDVNAPLAPGATFIRHGTNWLPIPRTS